MSRLATPGFSHTDLCHVSSHWVGGNCLNTAFIKHLRMQTAYWLALIVKNLSLRAVRNTVGVMFMDEGSAAGICKQCPIPWMPELVKYWPLDLVDRLRFSQKCWPCAKSHLISSKLIGFRLSAAWFWMSSSLYWNRGRHRQISVYRKGK